MQTLRSHLLSGCLECNHRCAEGYANQRRECPTERMAGQPDIRIWIHISQIIVKVLQDTGQDLANDIRISEHAHRSNRVE